MSTPQEDNVLITSQPTVDYSSLAPEQTEPTGSDASNPETDVQADTETVLSEEDELLKLLETEETGETPEDDSEPSNDEDFEAKFEQHFEKTFGLKPEEAMTLVQELVQERLDREVRGQLIELQNTWGTDENETQQRLEAVREVYNTLSPENQAKFNNVKGAQAIWNRLQASGKAPKMVKGKSSTPAKSTPQFMFTQSQIDKMPIREYEAQAQKIAYAYANGLVQKG